MVGRLDDLKRDVVKWADVVLLLAFPWRAKPVLPSWTPLDPRRRPPPWGSFPQLKRLLGYVRLRLLPLLLLRRGRLRPRKLPLLVWGVKRGGLGERRGVARGDTRA